MKKTNTAIVTSGSLFPIKGYTPDPENGKYYVLAADGKLNLLTVEGYEKKPIRAAIATAEISPNADIYPVTGCYVIILDKVMQRKAKNPLTRKQVLAAIAMQNAIINDTTGGIGINIHGEDIDDVSIISDVAPHLIAGREYGFRPVTKAAKLQNKMLMKSEHYAVKHLHKDFKKEVRAAKKEAKSETPVTVADVISNAGDEMSEVLKDVGSGAITAADIAAEGAVNVINKMTGKDKKDAKAEPKAAEA